MLTVPKCRLTCRSWLLGERIVHVGDVDACKLLMTCEHDLVEGELTSPDTAGLQSKHAKRKFRQAKSWYSASMLYHIPCAPCTAPQPAALYLVNLH